jgi:hypothetical protein
MALSKLDLNTMFVTVDEDTPAGLALSELLHETFIVVQGQNANGEKAYQVLLASALTHVVESTPLKEISVGALPTDVLDPSLGIQDAKSRVDNNPDFVFLALDEAGKPLGVLPSGDDLIIRPPGSTGMIELQCQTCGKYVLVTSGPGRKTCPIYGHFCTEL